MKVHQRNEPDARPLQCSRCHVTFKKDATLKKHEECCNTEKGTVKRVASARVIERNGPDDTQERQSDNEEVMSPEIDAEKPALAPRSKPKPWSEDDIQQLQRLNAEGKCARQIAEDMGRTTVGVSAKLVRAGVRSKNHGRSWTDTEVSKAMELKLEGYTYLQISEVINRSEQAVCDKLARHPGLGAQQWHEDEIRQLREMQQQGRSKAFIAKALRRTPGAIAHMSEEPFSFRWSDQRKESLMQKVLQYKTNAQIAKELGTTVDAVKGQKRKMSLRMPKPPANAGLEL